MPLEQSWYQGPCVPILCPGSRGQLIAKAAMVPHLLTGEPLWEAEFSLEQPQLLLPMPGSCEPAPLTVQRASLPHLARRVGRDSQKLFGPLTLELRGGQSPGSAEQSR